MQPDELLPELPGYRIHRRIGGGGMGEVFEAEDLALGRSVAIKRLRADRADQEAPAFGAWSARFRREARLLAAVDHPNIAVVYSAVEHGGLLHLVMEFVDGICLREALRAGPLTVDESLAVARQLAAGLLAAHEAGVIHRDIKPENIIISKRDAVKILDFGLAREHAPPGTNRGDGPEATTVLRTRPGAFVGTAGYAPPEQVLGDFVDQRADVFSFGCVLYEMLTGRRAFEPRGGNGAGVVLDSPVDFAALPEGTPDFVRRFLQQSLAASPDQRPAGLGGLIYAIAPVAGDATSRNDPVGAGAAADPIPSNLPPLAGAIIGRDAELAQAVEHLGAGRNVLLVGLGGVGKSRLAIELGRCITAADRRGALGRDSVTLVRISAAMSPRQVFHSAARAIGLAPVRGKPVPEQIAARIGESRPLLIIDACEHSPGACRELIETVLSRCPNAQIIATSRERLGFADERPLPLGALGVAADRKRRAGGSRGSASGSSIGSAGPSAAAEFFIARARRAWPPFQASGGDLNRIESICRRLGGLPLAIEIAASFVEAVTLVELDERLSAGLQILSDVPSDADDRTLQSVLEWSYARLSEPERMLLVRLSVFTSDFTLEAAEAVGADAAGGPSEGTIAPRRVLGLLAALVRRSMVKRRDAASAGEAGATRYALLDPLREFLAEKHPADDAAQCAGRMTAYFARLVAVAAAKFEGARQQEALELVEREYGNLTAASRAPAGADPRDVLELCVWMTPFWYMSWLASDGEAALAAAIDRRIASEAGAAGGAPADSMLARGWKSLGILRWMLGRREDAVDCLTRALRVAGAAGDRAQEASIRVNLGMTLVEVCRLEDARVELEAAASLYNELNDPVRRAQAELNLGMLEVTAGRLPEAEVILSRCVEVFERIGDRARAVVARSNLADAAFNAGELAEAASGHRRAMVDAQACGHERIVAHSVFMLAATAWKAGLLWHAARLDALLRLLWVGDEALPVSKRSMAQEMRDAIISTGDAAVFSGVELVEFDPALALELADAVVWNLRPRPA